MPLAGLLIASAVAGEPAPPMQLFGFMVLREQGDAPMVEFARQPAVRSREDVAFLRSIDDGISVIQCTSVSSSGQVSHCARADRSGGTERLDAIAVRAMRVAVLSPAQTKLFAKDGEGMILTFRFSDKTDIPDDCPPTMCVGATPPPPPPPPRPLPQPPQVDGGGAVG